MLKKTIKKGVKYLASQQQPDGSFISLSTKSQRSFKHARKHHSTFPSSLILSILCGLDETPEIKLIKDKLAKFLLSQKSQHWSFNHWTKNSTQAKTIPYPDDLDCAFCALSALYQYDPNLIDGSAMAKAVTLLTAVEEKEGGPYRTWLVPQNSAKVWKDIDLAVNSNVAYFLSLHDVRLPNINSLVKQAIADNKFHSPYYSSIYPVIYFISRFYPSSSKLIKALLSKRDKHYKWTNPLNTALAVSSLLNFNVSPRKISKSIDYLIQRQQKGIWKAYPFVTELVQKGKTTYAGSSALTTAFCLEALSKYQSSLNQKSKPPKIMNDQSKKIHQQVVQRAKKRFSKLNTDSQKLFLKQLNKTLKTDKHQPIILLPYLFQKSLDNKGKKIKPSLLIELGLANLYGWIAYTIYDDFLDDEGQPKQLSVANICLRELTTIYNSLLKENLDFTSFFHQIMDTLDNANIWEVTYCRFNPTKKPTKIPDYKNYSKLAERSLGHALGPIAILFSLGYKPSSPEIKNLMKFFKHYLIARQLNDDAHDWEQDLKMGHINSVGAEILKNLKLKRSKQDSQSLQQIFWYKTVVNVCNQVLKHTQKARGYIEKVSVVSNIALFEKILVPIEKSAQKALKDRQETLKFLKSYS